MKVISTADWHLGNVFHGIDRLPEHRHFLKWLLETLESERPDALLIAGDVFDNGNPSEGAQKLFYGFLRDVSRILPEMHTVIIAGNHDSARLEAPRDFTELLNVHIRARVGKRWISGDAGNPGYWSRDYDDLIIPLPDRESPEMLVLAVPYLRMDSLNGGSYSDGAREILGGVTARAGELWPGIPSLMMAHLYASGAEIARQSSERIMVGGLEQIDFSGWSARPDFLTAGHIHKRQRIAGTDWASYTGSALPMSFAEKNYSHGVDLIMLDEDGVFSRSQIEYIPEHRLVDIPEKKEDEDFTFASLRKEIRDRLKPKDGDMPGPACAYVRLHIKKEKIADDRRRELENMVESLDAVLCAVDEVSENAVSSVVEGLGELRKIDDILERNPLDSLREAFLLRHDKELSPRQVEIVSRLLAD